MDVADMDAVIAALDTPEAKEAKDRDGVLAETTVTLIEA